MFTRLPLMLVLVVVGLSLMASPAHALIQGGEGNKPVTDPGWPKGAADIFNHASRIAYWVGPPFGGGQWHAEYRGDAETLNAILAGFAKLDVKNKRVVVHDGIGKSFWLNPNDEPDKKAMAEMDFRFMVWESKRWEALRNLPPDLNPISPREKAPPAQIDVYAGGGVRWADVKVPEGIELIDRRLEAHGYSLNDGVVMEGNVTDADTARPLACAVRLEAIEPQQKGGYAYTLIKEASTDKEGHWSIKNVPAGWYRAVAVADGYVPRILAHARFDGQPGWNEYHGQLVKGAAVTGQVDDEKGRPLADVTVQLGDITLASGERYPLANNFETKTDAKGRFRFDAVPPGKARVWVRKAGYVRPGLGLSIEPPAKDLSLTMQPAAQATVTVDFGDRKPEGEYIVSMEPEGGSAPGKWSGSSRIDDKSQATFRDVPAGRYIFFGRPNPGADAEQTDPITLDLQGGKSHEVRIKAK